MKISQSFLFLTSCLKLLNEFIYQNYNFNSYQFTSLFIFMTKVYSDQSINAVDQNSNLADLQDSNEINVEKKQKKKFNASEIKQMLEKRKQNIQNFISLLGNAKNQAFRVGDYHLDSRLEKLCKYIKSENIIEIIENIVRKMNTNKRLKKNWNQEDILVLVWIIQKYNLLRNTSASSYSQYDWFFISQLIPGKSPQQCMFKWLNLQKGGQKIPPWTQRQDEILRELAIKSNQEYKWNQISKELYLKNSNFKIYRSPKKCRQRWQCYLNPNIRKGIWTSGQDYILLKKSFEIGKKWSQISKQLRGRTQNAVKNRYQLLCEKSKKQKNKSNLSQKQFLQNYVKQIEINQMLSTQKVQTPVTDEFQYENQQLFKNTYDFIYPNQESLKKVKIQNQQKLYKQCQNEDQQSVKFMKIPVDALLFRINNNIQEMQEAHYDQQSMELIYLESQDEDLNDKAQDHYKAVK